MIVIDNNDIIVDGDNLLETSEALNVFNIPGIISLYVISLAPLQAEDTAPSGLTTSQALYKNNESFYGTKPGIHWQNTGLRLSPDSAFQNKNFLSFIYHFSPNYNLGYAREFVIINSAADNTLVSINNTIGNINFQVQPDVSFNYSYTGKEIVLGLTVDYMTQKVKIFIDGIKIQEFNTTQSTPFENSPSQGIWISRSGEPSNSIVYNWLLTNTLISENDVILLSQRILQTGTII